MPPRQPSPEGLARDPRFYRDHIVFLVEDRLFKVPRHEFVASPVFRDMFALPASDTETAEGVTDDEPVRLDGIKRDDFRALLHIMLRPHYNPSWEEAEEPSTEDWIAVLKLTTMWEFACLRRTAICELSLIVRTELDPFDWVCLARQYSVHEWLFPALHALARRTQPLQADEADRLGIATVLRMAEVRESYVGCKVDHVHTHGKHFDQHHQTIPRLQHDFTNEIRRVFKEELEQCDEY
ncbi:hypothetical protein OH77DRAFT_1499446 [Trametes cingulata]|nr:hypothetical protein OH77DRAFT_1499446 [Trametes cingulata]